MAARTTRAVAALCILAGFLAGCAGGKTQSAQTTATDAPQQAASPGSMESAEPMPLGSSSPQAMSDAAPAPGALTGAWTGEISQVLAPMTRRFSLNVKTQQGNVITGTSRIEQGPYYGVMAFVAFISGDGVHYAETGTLDDNPPPGTQWCLKAGQFLLSDDRADLSGKWEARGCNLGHVALHFTGAAAAQTQAVSAQAAPLPAVIHEREGAITTTWTRDGDGYRMEASNGAEATLTVASFAPSAVVIERTDRAGSRSAGLTAVYLGKLSLAGDSASGSVTWEWPGNRTETGAWSATWDAATAQAAQEQAP